MRIYQVGGSVRDEILGVTPKDFDYVVVGASEEMMITLGYRKVEASSFPVFLDSKGREFALARRETKTGYGYHGFNIEFGPDVTLEEDLLRRDFTINAIAKDIETGELIDPLGGMGDIANRVFSVCNPKAFHEDPVRVLRLAKFASRYSNYGFLATEQTELLARKAVQELEYVKGERVYQELIGILAGCSPSIGFNVLLQLGALDIVLPEVANLITAEQNPEFHPEGNAYIHTMMVLMEARARTADPMVLFGALLHDIGKIGKYPHLEHSEVGAAMVSNIAKRLCFPRKVAEFCKMVCLEHMRAHRIFEMRDSKKIELYERTKKFGYENALIVFDSDICGRCAHIDYRFMDDRRDLFRVIESSIAGADFSKVRSSKSPASLAQQIKIESFRRAWDNK